MSYLSVSSYDPKKTHSESYWPGVRAPPSDQPLTNIQHRIGPKPHVKREKETYNAAHQLDFQQQDGVIQNPTPFGYVSKIQSFDMSGDKTLSHLTPRSGNMPRVVDLEVPDVMPNSEAHAQLLKGRLAPKSQNENADQLIRAQITPPGAAADVKHVLTPQSEDRLYENLNKLSDLLSHSIKVFTDVLTDKEKKQTKENIIQNITNITRTQPDNLTNISQILNQSISSTDNSNFNTIIRTIKDLTDQFRNNPSITKDDLKQFEYNLVKTLSQKMDDQTYFLNDMSERNLSHIMNARLGDSEMDVDNPISPVSFEMLVDNLPHPETARTNAISDISLVSAKSKVSTPSIKTESVKEEKEEIVSVPRDKDHLYRTIDNLLFLALNELSPISDPDERIRYVSSGIENLPDSGREAIATEFYAQYPNRSEQNTLNLSRTINSLIRGHFENAPERISISSRTSNRTSNRAMTISSNSSYIDHNRNSEATAAQPLVVYDLLSNSTTKSKPKFDKPKSSAKEKEQVEQYTRNMVSELVSSAGNEANEANETTQTLFDELFGGSLGSPTTSVSSSSAKSQRADKRTRSKVSSSSAKSRRAGSKRLRKQKRVNYKV